MLERKMDKTIDNCRPFCTNYEISENEWCDCMHQCSQDVLNKISLGNMDMRIYIKECP